MIYDDTCCTLGEGPLWHPTRKELFWFDIIGKKLHRKGQSWTFSSYVSAAGWIDQDSLLIASDKALHRFDITTGASEIITPLEAHLPANRSNDGRADPQGGFWIGTMGVHLEKDSGAIYRYYRGELRQLYAPITIPNAISFAPDGQTAYFADTAKKTIWRVRLDADGWPQTDPEVHIDLTGTNLNPDGAVVDSAGNLWNAQWGASRVACYAPDATLLTTVGFPALQTSCPAFGGPDLTTLYCTSAAEGLPQDDDQGRVYAAQTETTGQPEHRVIL